MDKTFQQLVTLEKQGKISKKEKQRLAGFRAAQSRSKNRLAQSSKAQVKRKNQVKKTARKNANGKASAKHK